MISRLMATVAVLGLMGAAPAPLLPSKVLPEETSRCIYPRQVERIGNDAGAKRRYFQASGGRVFRLDTTTDCFEPSTRGVHLEPYVATSQRMCAGDEVKVTALVSDLPRTCVARLSQQVSDPDEIRNSGLGRTGLN